MGQEPGTPLLPDVQPIAFSDPSGNVKEAKGRTAADDLTLPTALDVLAVLFGYDGANLDLLRTWSAVDGQATPPGLLAVAPMMRDGVNAAWRKLTAAMGDADNGAGSLAVQPYLVGGSTSDRMRGNLQGLLLASAARTASTNSPIQTNYNARGVIIYLNVTVAGTGNLMLYIRESAFLNAQLLVGAAVATTGAWAYVLYPGATTAEGHIVKANSGVLPRTWDVLIAHSDGSSWTYQVNYALIN